MDCKTNIIRVSPISVELLEIVKKIALRSGRPTRPLHLQALLQLPRLADKNGKVDADKASSLISELAEEIPYESFWKLPNYIRSPLKLPLLQVPIQDAEIILKTFHYLRSPRFDGRSYGLYQLNNQDIVALCISSPLDVDRLKEILRSIGRSERSARVISRVFSFVGAPPNTISHMLSLAAKKEKRLGVTDFLTYVNPNMGFTGASYLASNWKLIGEEMGTTYRYIDSRYITDRQIVAKYGTLDELKLNNILGKRFSISQMPLCPLKVFHIAIDYCGVP